LRLEEKSATDSARSKRSFAADPRTSRTQAGIASVAKKEDGLGEKLDSPKPEIGETGHKTMRIFRSGRGTASAPFGVGGSSASPPFGGPIKAGIGVVRTQLGLLCKSIGRGERPAPTAKSGKADDLREVRNYVDALEYGVAHLNEIPLSQRLHAS
jgi:hypothetical protein